MEWKHELGAGVFLVVTLTILSLFAWGQHQRTLRQEAEAKLVMVDLELAGAKKALLVKPKDVAPPETPKEVKEAIKKKLVTPIVGVTGKATSNVVNIPCPEPIRSTDESLTKGPAPQEDKPAPVAVPVTFDLTGNLFLGQIKKGQALWTGGVSGVVHSGDFEAPIEFDPANVNIEVKVSEEIGKAVAYYERGWWRKHTALVCPGVGVTYNPLDSARPVNVGVTCTYGFSWF
jgi:hypothetical protein